MLSSESFVERSASVSSMRRMSVPSCPRARPQSPSITAPDTSCPLILVSVNCFRK